VRKLPLLDSRTRQTGANKGKGQEILDAQSVENGAQQTVSESSFLADDQV
jgi:hypothetical protein